MEVKATLTTTCRQSALREEKLLRSSRILDHKTIELGEDDVLKKIRKATEI